MTDTQTLLAAWRALAPSAGLTLADFADATVAAARQIGLDDEAADVLWRDVWAGSAALAERGILRSTGVPARSGMGYPVERFAPVAAWGERTAAA